MLKSQTKKPVTGLHLNSICFLKEKISCLSYFLLVSPTFKVFFLYFCIYALIF